MSCHHVVMSVCQWLIMSACYCDSDSFCQHVTAKWLITSACYGISDLWREYVAVPVTCHILMLLHHWRVMPSCYWTSGFPCHHVTVPVTHRISMLLHQWLVELVWYCTVTCHTSMFWVTSAKPTAVFTVLQYFLLFCTEMYSDTLNMQVAHSSDLLDHTYPVWCNNHEDCHLSSMCYDSLHLAGGR